ncbi:MAG: hypothetical protein ACREQM_18190 [Candidatus Dormibacteraceae bacterium]
MTLVPQLVIPSLRIGLQGKMLFNRLYGDSPRPAAATAERLAAQVAGG